jgi:hypothetical protein
VERRAKKLFRFSSVTALALLSVLIGSCTAVQKTDTKETLKWKKSDVIGLTMELDDPVRYLFYSFYPRGTLVMTAGEKNGYLVSPLSEWTIRNGVLDAGGHRLRLVSRDLTTIRALNEDGEEEVFLIK